jgi:hypothetical protein
MFSGITFSIVTSLLSFCCRFEHKRCIGIAQKTQKIEKKFKIGLQSFLLMLYYIPVAPDKGDDEVD